MFKNRNFLKLWISQMLSQVAINLMNFEVSLPLLMIICAGIILVVPGAVGALIVTYSLPRWLYSQLSFLLIIASTLPILAAGTLADILGVATPMGLIGLLLLAFFYLLHRKGDYVLANGFGI